jgi:Rrf2 family iron-sulfur cluster assembly transcriptional regulator
MKLGKDSRYAIEGLVVLAKSPFGTKMQLRDIADAAGVPPNFLAKIFQKLNRANIVASSRGVVRGYALARRSKAVNVKDILLAVEGSDIFDRCVFWSDRCAEATPCPMHIHWKRVRQSIAALMKRTTVADLAKHAPSPGKTRFNLLDAE